MNHQRVKYLFEHAYKYAEENRPDELEWGKSIKPDTFENMSTKDFLSNYCWVIYASGFRVSVIEKKFPQLKAVYHNFDLEKLARMETIDPVLPIFNHHNKANWFLRGAKQIHQEGFENFKTRVKQKGMPALKALPGIGKITQKHLAKNIGLADVPKDDVWLNRLKELCEAKNVEELIAYLAEKYDKTQHVVDLVLWRFCANAGWRYYGANV